MIPGTWIFGTAQSKADPSSHVAEQTEVSREEAKKRPGLSCPSSRKAAEERQNYRKPGAAQHTQTAQSLPA